MLGLLIFLSLVQANYLTGLYYAEWTYEADHLPSDIPLSAITNLFYAFFKVDENTMQLHTDSSAVATRDQVPFHTDQLMGYLVEHEFLDPAADTWMSSYLKNVTSMDQIYSVGLLGQLSQIKAINNNIHISMSVGGAETNEMFEKITRNEVTIEAFVKSAVEFIKFYGFDGIDIDWEYPSSGSKLTVLIKSLRASLPDKYLVTIALPSDIKTLAHYNLAELVRSVSFFSLMGYDMGGIWDERSLFQSQLYTDPNVMSQGSVNETVQYLLQYMAADQLVLGMPSYGRSFKASGLYENATKCAKIKGIQQNPKECLVYYNELPPSGYKEVYDETTGAVYARGPGGVITYDNYKSARLKAKYVKEHGLAGGFWWDSSGDDYSSERSLLLNFVDELGGLGALQNGTIINTNLYYGELRNQTYREDGPKVGGAKKKDTPSGIVACVMMPLLVMLYLTL